MPALTVTNSSSTTATCVSDPGLAGVSIFLNPSQTRTVQLTPNQFENLAPVLATMFNASKVTYSVATNSTIPANLDLGGPVKKATSAMFVSAVTATTGSAQSVAHGLGAVPTVVLIVPVDGATVTEGTHTITNVVFTGTVSKNVKILAML